MKNSFVLIVLMFFCFKLCAQSHSELLDMLKGESIVEEPHTPTKEVANHINAEVYIFDSVLGHKTINNSLRLLYIGGFYPNHRLASNRRIAQARTGV